MDAFADFLFFACLASFLIVLIVWKCFDNHTRQSSLALSSGLIVCVHQGGLQVQFMKNFKPTILLIDRRKPYCENRKMYDMYKLHVKIAQQQLKKKKKKSNCVGPLLVGESCWQYFYLWSRVLVPPWSGCGINNAYFKNLDIGPVWLVPQCLHQTRRPPGNIFSARPYVVH